MKVLAIIPCYNEEKNLKSVVENLKAEVPSIDFIIVNDGSQDNTHEICVENHYPVIDIPFNLGLANAVQTGMRYAYNNNYEMALQFDGDGQHLPEYIPQMIKFMQETSADIIIGSRHIMKKSTHKQDIFMKKGPLSLRGLGGNLLRLTVKITTGKTLTDPTSGMRLFSRKMIQEFAKHINYGPEPDTLTYLMNLGISVLETPVIMQERKAGKSYLSAFNAVNYMLRMFISIIIIQWFRLRRNDL